MIRLARPLLGAAEQEAVAAVLDSGWLVQGPKVAEFEGLLAPRTGCERVLCCSSGTAALHLAIAALNLPPGSTVALPAYTFPATLNVVLLEGLQPRLIDVDPLTFNLCPNDAAQVLESGVELLLAVHQFGLPAPLGLLQPQLDAQGTALVEDAACALGASLHFGGEKRPVGSLGALGCFSFHPRKLITTGEGGAVTTRVPELADRVSLLRNHGMRREPGQPAEFHCPGWNYRMSDIHAAIGVAQMERLDALVADRRRIAAGYHQRMAFLEPRGLVLPHEPEGTQSVYQSYVVLLPEGSSVPEAIEALHEGGIEASVGAQGLHRQPAYHQLAGFDRPLPGTEQCCDRALALPTPPKLSDPEMDQVADAVAALIA